MEQYLNYILMIRNENNLTILTIFFSQLKALIKNFIYKRDKTGIAERFSKISNTKKMPNKQFHHFESNMFLENVTKSINSQTNIKSSGNDSLTAKFHKDL